MEGKKHLCRLGYANSIVDNSLNGLKDHNQILVTISSYEITRGLLRCLLPGQWLHSQVINTYLVLLEDRQKSYNNLKCHYFNTWFYTKLTKNGYNYTDNISRWTRKLNYTIFYCDLIFIPIHKHNHWALVVIDLKKRNKIFRFLTCGG